MGGAGAGWEGEGGGGGGGVRRLRLRPDFYSLTRPAKKVPSNLDIDLPLIQFPFQYKNIRPNCAYI